MHTHTNRLIHETSPYLLQHAHNPVEWYPWGEEALQRAKDEDKPIIVSIGYSACHWCHVMERESFEKEDIAEIMNAHFINIKVDREERPDIDHIYMDAVQAMTGSGGWPLNCFLLPDGKPFYGGTYYPPVRAHNRESWREILYAVIDAYQKRKNELESQAENLTEHLKQSNAFGMGKLASENVSEQTLQEIADNILRQADTNWGGFGRAPKFPQTFSIQFLLRHAYFSGHEASLKQALLSLDKMIYGGIYDQLGGGFARYSTDEKWLAPHFEKMLYDNALLISVLSEAYQFTQLPLYLETIHQTMGYIEREMLNTEGGFYSALDADSEGVEGKFYTWSKAEVDQLLKDDAAIFCEYYNVTDEGNWEDTNILWIQTSLADFATLRGLNADGLASTLARCREKLFIEREKKIRPGLDDKMLLSWNALLNIACSKAFGATSEEKYRSLAIRNMKFIEKAFYDVTVTKWFHSYKNEQSKYAAFLEDYANLISAYIHLQEITGDEAYLYKAKELTEAVKENFEEQGTGYFFFTSNIQQDVIVRKKEIYDGATPSGNSVMAFNLQYLGMVFDQQSWIEQARAISVGLLNLIVKYPTSFGNWAMQIQSIIHRPYEIAVVGDKSLELLQQVLEQYIPGRVLQSSTNGNNNFPLLENKIATVPASIYICREYMCLQPISNASLIKSLLK